MSFSCSGKKRTKRSRPKGALRANSAPLGYPPAASPVLQCMILQSFVLRCTRQVRAWWGYLGGGGLEAAAAAAACKRATGRSPALSESLSNQLNASPKSASFGYFSCRNKKSTAPAGIPCFETYHSGFFTQPFRRRNANTGTEYCRTIQEAGPYNGV